MTTEETKLQTPSSLPTPPLDFVAYSIGTTTYGDHLSTKRNAEATLLAYEVGSNAKATKKQKAAKPTLEAKQAAEANLASAIKSIGLSERAYSRKLREDANKANPDYEAPPTIHDKPRPRRTISSSNGSTMDPRCMGLTFHPGEFIGFGSSSGTSASFQIQWDQRLADAQLKLDGVVASAKRLGLKVTATPTPTEGTDEERTSAVLAEAKRITRITSPVKAAKTRAHTLSRVSRIAQELLDANAIKQDREGYRWFMVSFCHTDWEKRLAGLRAKGPEMVKATAKLIQGVILLPGGYAYIKVKVQEVAATETFGNLDSYGRRYYISEEKRSILSLCIASINPAASIREAKVMEQANSPARTKWAGNTDWWMGQ